MNRTLGSTCARRSRQPRSRSRATPTTTPRRATSRRASPRPRRRRSRRRRRRGRPARRRAPGAVGAARLPPGSGPYVVSTGAADQSCSEYDSRARFSSGLCGPSSSWLGGLTGGGAAGDRAGRAGIAPRHRAACVPLPGPERPRQAHGVEDAPARTAAARSRSARAAAGVVPPVVAARRAPMSLSEKAASRLVLTSASWGLNDGAFVPSARAALRERALRDAGH